MRFMDQALSAAGEVLCVGLVDGSVETVGSVDGSVEPVGSVGSGSTGGM